MRKAKPVLISDVMINEGFRGKTMSEALNSYVISPDLKEFTEGIETSWEAEIVREGVIQIRYKSRLLDLKKSLSIIHRYSFPLLHESREKGFRLTRDNPEAESDILVAFGDYKKNYFNISVHDSSNYLMHCDVLVYNSLGELKPYFMPEERFVSPLAIKAASCEEIVNENNQRVLRSRLEFHELSEPATILVGYNAVGITMTEKYVVDSSNRVVVSDLLLDENPDIIPGEWVIGMTDDQNRLLFNVLARLEVVY